MDILSNLLTVSSIEDSISVVKLLEATKVATIALMIQYNLSTMDQNAGLTNDQDIDFYDAEANVIQNTIISSIDNSKLGVLLGADKKYSYSTNKILQGALTLRECNVRYRESQGCKDKGEYFAEFDRCQTKGSISPLRRFDNIVGHFVELPEHNNIPNHSIICFKPELCTTFIEFKNSLERDFRPSITRRYLWNLLNTNICFKTGSDKWMYNNEILDLSISTTLDILSISFPAPLSAHSQHAWFESLDNKDIISRLKIFNQPEETTAVTGILGTLQNNQLIDLAQESDNESVNINSRQKDIDIPGFLCSGHTAHSMEAGRVRRVCHGVSIRLINENMLNILYRILTIVNKYNNDSKQWVLFCMGKFIYCSTGALIFIRNQLVSLSSTNINTCTIHINKEMHTAILSVSSGSLLRRDSNNLVIDTTSIYSDPWPDNKYIPTFPSLDTDEGFKFHFSGFFQLTPYIAFDRPPRTLISSVQSIQVATTPYGAGTSSVAPTHTSKPLVSTPLIEDLMYDTTIGDECNLSDLLPGEDLVVCFANFNDTNEDSIMMSEDSVGRGLFSYMAYSAHVIKDGENIPEIGTYATMNENRWWKCYSRREISRKLNHDPKYLIAGGDGRGKVISRNMVQQTNEISVKILRYSTPVTGDKFATGHGQKGVIKLTPGVNMPWGIDDNGEPIRFDMVISLSSITNRLTNGQYYEMTSGVRAAKEGRRLIVAPSNFHDNHYETELYDGKTGNIIERVSDNGDVPIKASWGINRIWQMTQLTWDKQHYTHNTAGKHSIVTSTGRTAGGGIRFGEMEGHAVDASGLTEPYRELRSRMDLIDVEMCINCDLLVQMCSCNNSEGYTTISIPHSMMIFKYSNLLTSGLITKSKVSF